MAAVDETRIQYVSVTNGLDEPITDMFDGIPVKIDPGKKDNLHIEVAAHIFGYHPGVTQESMFRHFSKRQGWNTKEHMEPEGDTGKSKAQAKFDKIGIKPVTFRMVPADEDAEPDAPIPAEPEARKPPRRIAI
jgi:hypothetical protein